MRSMMGSLARRWSSGMLVLALVTGTLVPAAAQSSNDTGIIQIIVKDAAAQQTLADARVFLLGPTVASALTTKSGIVKYTDVPTGLYRVRVSKSGYAGIMSSRFELLGNKQVDVDVDLSVQKERAAAQATPSNANAGALKVIGHVSARVTVTTTDVDENSAVRRISDSLTDALSTIGGVDVTQDSNDPNAPQTISLRGRDESQTAVTLDGIPLNAPGSAADLRRINTDLFSGAGVNFGASAGALGGSVNFRTLQPTQTWQTKIFSSYGTFDKYYYQIGETGSIGKLGIALLHTKRAGNSPLTFQRYLDQSGLTYAHGGESANSGDFLKLRYGLTDHTTMLFTALQNNQATSSLCTRFVTPLPCGIGPNNGNNGRFQFAYGTVQSLIGDTAVTLTGYVNDNTSFTNDLNRSIFSPQTGTTTLSPYAAQNTTLARGVAANATLTRDKHTITLSGSTYAAVTTFTPVVGGSDFVRRGSSGVASRSVQLADQLKVNDKLTLGPNVSFASTTGSGSSLLAGFSAGWRPTGIDSYNASVSVGSSQPAAGIVRSFSDPLAARVNCFAGTAQVNGPGDQPAKQSAINYDASWTHAWTHGQFSLNTYRQSQSGQLVNAQVTGESLGLPGTSYFNDITTYFDTVCGVGGMPAVYVNQLVGGTTRVYQGFIATARLGISPNVVVIPSYSTTSATVTAADPRYTGLDSTLVLGEQIPGRPLHTANLTIDAFHPRTGIELLANAHYVGENNSQHIAPYTLVNVGLSHALGIGRLTIFASNLFNTESGTFSTLLYAQPIPLSGGGTLLQAANPNAPRQYTVTFSFNTGARPGAGFARSSRASQAATAATQPQQQRGFGRLNLVAPPAGSDPMTVATSRQECTADLRPIAEKVLGQLKAGATAYGSGASALPDVDGLAVTRQGDPKATWWLDLGPKIPVGVFLNRQGQGQLGGDRTDVGYDPAGRGGPPGGFRDRMVVGTNAAASPRPNTTPRPELIQALLPLRALASCAYGTVLTTTQAKAKGFDIQPGVLAASPPRAPGASRVRALRRFGSPFHYAPEIGLFVVLPPDLGTGGGSVKQ
jgi:hypothetical protein